MKCLYMIPSQLEASLELDEGCTNIKGNSLWRKNMMLWMGKDK